MPSADVYRKIEAALEARRRDARMALEARRAEAFARCPELERLEEARARHALECNRRLLAGEITAQEAEAEIAGIAAEHAKKAMQMLAAHKFPKNYLALQPTCKKCGDTGLLPRAGANGLDRPPERCSCWKQLLLDNLYDESNLLAAGDADFSQFNAALFSEAADEKKYGVKASPRENIRGIFESARRFASAFPRSAGENMYFFGQAGTGKTFMAACIAKAVMAKGHSVFYQSATTLFNLITEYRTRAFRDDDYSDALYKSILACELLVIDDLGSEPTTDSRYAEFITLLNARLGLAGKPKSTIISTNYTIPDLRNEYDERVSSRISGAFTPVYFYGDDLRHS